MDKSYSEDDVRQDTEDQIQSAEPEMMPVGLAQNPELTKWQLDPTELFIWLEHELKGEVMIGQNKWEQKGVRQMNDVGIASIISYIRQYTNKAVYLSNINEQEVYDITRNFGFNITQLLFNNGENFAIDWSNSYQSPIVTMLCDIVFFSLQRASGKTTLNFLGSHTKILHRIDESPMQKRDKKLGIF